MHLERDRKKKLVLAFHYHLASQIAGRTGWDCESCRQHGLEMKRRCGFLAEERRGPAVVVWGRRQVTSEECPNSAIQGSSTALVEEFLVNRRLGIPTTANASARKIDAFLILTEQIEREERDVTTEY